MSQSTSTVQVTNRGWTKTTTKITSIKNAEGEWVEAEKVVTIEQIDGPLLAPEWAKTRSRYVQPHFEQFAPLTPIQPPPGTPWGAPTVWA